MKNNAYLDLLKKVLIDWHRTGIEYKDLNYTTEPSWKLSLLQAADRFLRDWRGFAICRLNPYRNKEEHRRSTWPANAEAMVGLNRMDNVEFCVRDVLEKGIEGDLIETGVWRGGVCIFMRAILKEYGDTKRKVWVADSFEGLPIPTAEIDKKAIHHTRPELTASFEQVKENFEKYGLLDDQVKFLKGWFKDTLHKAPIEKLAILRLDGDMYESTVDALVLYPKLSKGGYCIVDDYCLPACRKAIDEFRTKNNITSPLISIDGEAYYWQV